MSQLRHCSNSVPREEEWRIFATETWKPLRQRLTQKWPRVWAEDNSPRMAINQPPVQIELKPGALPISQRKYLI